MPTALIVEDEPEANRLLAMLVQLRGYSTESAFTGGDALDKAFQRPPDIVFLDLMLPDIDGYEVCKTLKSSKATSLVPVIMVTARVAAENRVRSFGVGADDYVPKPYTPDQIFQAMNNATSSLSQCADSTIKGFIPIELGVELESLRRFGQLSNLLVARTSLDLAAIQAITTALKEIWQEALRWTRQSSRPLDTALAFQIQPDRLVVTLHDTSGWLAESRSGPLERWTGSLAGAGFDEVIIEETGRRMNFIKRYPPDTPTLPS
jgi:DNA-binding response OmpR family regulator